VIYVFFDNLAQRFSHKSHRAEAGNTELAGSA
jgi:hypothetical protein